MQSSSSRRLFCDDLRDGCIRSFGMFVERSCVCGLWWFGLTRYTIEHSHVGPERLLVNSQHSTTGTSRSPNRRDRHEN